MERERIPFAFRKGSPFVQSRIGEQIIARQFGFECRVTFGFRGLVGSIHGGFRFLDDNAFFPRISGF